MNLFVGEANLAENPEQEQQQTTFLSVITFGMHKNNIDESK